MKITANEEYGLRIMLRIAKILSKTDDVLVSLHDIAEAEGISVENTAAILVKIKNAGLIESVRGKYGGYRLAKPISEINLYEVINAVGKDSFTVDFCDTHTGLKETCVHSTDCSIRPIWSTVTNLINNFLSGITLEKLMNSEASSKGFAKTMLRDLEEVLA